MARPANFDDLTKSTIKPHASRASICPTMPPLAVASPTSAMPVSGSRPKPVI
eukprot:CAMPEP_0194155564 /NCGR_PEP_ID=MMETSP0152-20130528/65082_1 /TAXON_ID=1049557 /ORGANISM="Thalassiothrix antarctica, Strain L6-D1" /LENGTH=51 /DNA_ID=CAMNT_0038862537 /DNA_START=1155 /DNA_END=1310 /DNA_ORIENTATION=-